MWQVSPAGTMEPSATVQALPPLDPMLAGFIATAPQGLTPSWEDLSERFEQLKQKADVIEERVLTAGGAARLVQDFCERADQRASAHGAHLSERLQAMEGRVELLERAGGDENAALREMDGGVVAGWQEEVLRLRGEVAAGVQEINEQLGERLRKLECWQDDLEAELRQSVSEALETCSRLADDSLAASEATQLKLVDLRDVMEARHGDFKTDLSGLRRDLEAQAGGSAAAMAIAPQEATERAVFQLADELGGQIYRLGSALRRIVQVQREHQHQLVLQQSGPEDSRHSPRLAMQDIAPQQPISVEVGPQAAHPARSEASQRHATIVALYEELRRLEEGLPSAPGRCRQGAASAQTSSRLRRRRGCQLERRCSRERRCSSQRPIELRCSSCCL